MAGSPQIVALRCDETTFGIPIDRVREIVIVPEITPVPESGEFIRGIINLRGRIIPVMDLGRRLGLREAPRDRSGRILIAEDGGSHLIGLLVDEASEVLRVPEANLGPPPELLGGRMGGAVRGIAHLPERLILLLDLDRVLAEPAPAEVSHGAASA
jgi:purine-binding chemotaxis protein CheW